VAPFLFRRQDHGSRYRTPRRAGRGTIFQNWRVHFLLPPIEPAGAEQRRGSPFPKIAAFSNARRDTWPAIVAGHFFSSKSVTGISGHTKPGGGAWFSTIGKLHAPSISANRQFGSG
jgi:hypothetical protein